MKYLIILILLFTNLFFVIGCNKSFDSISNQKQELFDYHITVFKTYEEILGDTHWLVEDFDFNRDKVYLWPTGPQGLYDYDLSTSQLCKLVDRLGGSFVTSDSDHVFFAMPGATICERYRIDDSTTTIINLVDQGSEFNFINGIDIYQGALYVILRKSWDHPEETYLLKYDPIAPIKEFIPYGKNTIYMTIANGILYSIDISDPDFIRLSRFNLATLNFLKDISHPTNSPDGIDIFEDKFYFTDYQQRYIGSVPLSEIER
jgi:hypothetical protein